MMKDGREGRWRDKGLGRLLEDCAGDGDYGQVYLQCRAG